MLNYQKVALLRQSRKIEASSEARLARRRPNMENTCSTIRDAEEHRALGKYLQEHIREFPNGKKGVN